MSARIIRLFTVLACASVTSAATAAAPAEPSPPLAPATTQSSEPSLQVYSVRIGRGRNNQDMQRRFAGRYYNESNPGVVMNLLMTLNDDAVFLSPVRDAINIETFVDDTYENLLGGSQNENRYSGQTPVVSV